MCHIGRALWMGVFERPIGIRCSFNVTRMHLALACLEVFEVKEALTSRC